jgi:hypothetical protein
MVGWLMMRVWLDPAFATSTITVAASASSTRSIAVAAVTAKPVEWRHRVLRLGAGSHWAGGHGCGCCVGPWAGGNQLVDEYGETGAWAHGGPVSAVGCRGCIGSVGAAEAGPDAVPGPVCCRSAAPHLRQKRPCTALSLHAGQTLMALVVSAGRGITDAMISTSARRWLQPLQARAVLARRRSWRRRYRPPLLCFRVCTSSRSKSRAWMWSLRR